MDSNKLDLIGELLGNECACLTFVLDEEILTPEERRDIEERLELVHRTQEDIQERRGSESNSSDGWDTVEQDPDEEMSEPVPTVYETSAEFTDELCEITSVINSERMFNWMNMTDSNFGTETTPKLMRLRLAISELWKELDRAE